MAVVNVQESIFQRSGSINNEAIQTYKRIFNVTTDDQADGPNVALNATGIPDVGDPHPDVSLALVESVNAKATSSPTVWSVEVQYSTETGNNSGTSPFEEENPLDRPSIIEWSFAQFQSPVEKDRFGNPVQNSAGDRFTGLSMDDSRPVLRITRNEGGFSPARSIAFKDAINEDNFFGAEPGQAKCQNIGARSRFENGFQFFEVRYEFHFRREGWNIEVLDEGFRQIDPSFPDPIPITEVIVDASGTKLTDTPVSVPAKLDGSGKRLAPGDDVVFLEFELYEPKNFADLNLP